jgi:hypothetical protein
MLGLGSKKQLGSDTRMWRKSVRRADALANQGRESLSRFEQLILACCIPLLQRFPRFPEPSLNWSLMAQSGCRDRLRSTVTNHMLK